MISDLITPPHVLCVSSKHLATSVEFVGEFDFAEWHRSLHPVCTEVGRVRVDVDTAVAVRLRFARRDPLAVHILPPVPIWRTEVQEDGVHGVGIQTCHAHFQNGKHPPGKWTKDFKEDLFYGNYTQKCFVENKI